MRNLVLVSVLVHFFCGLALSEEWQVEHITLTLGGPTSSAAIESDRNFILSSATTSIELEDNWVGIYRVILSASDTGAVRARLLDERWESVGSTPAAPPPLPLLRVHSPQVWGQVKVVILDVFPWRVSNGQLQVLKEARLEVTIRHLSTEILDGAAQQVVQGVNVANNRLVRAVSRTTRPLTRPRKQIPDQGAWLQIPLREDGLYHLTSDYLSGLGIVLADLDLTQLRLYAPTNLGRPLPAQVGAALEDNLLEIAIHIRDGGDGVLDTGDDILFYGQGPRGFDLIDGDLDYTQNPYANDAYAWLYIPDAAVPGTSLRMSEGPSYTAAAQVVAHGRAHFRHEADVFNGFDSGPVWHEVAIRKGSSFTIILPTPNLRVDDTTRLAVLLRGGSFGSHRVSLALNQSLLATTTGSVHSNMILRPDPEQISTVIRSVQNVITLTNNSTNPNPQEEVWFDWLELEYGLDLTADDNKLTFLIPQHEEQVNVQMMGFTAQPVVLDITDPARPVFQRLQEDQDEWLFTPSDLNTPRRFVAATNSSLLTPGSPTYYQELDFNTLRQTSRQADYIMITDSTLLSQAQELASIHSEEVRSDLRLSSFVTTIGEIYEEFSGGMVDPLAIRAFLRWTYEYWARPAPRLVVLFGDGDYDYRNLSGISHSLIPTIQVDGSSEISSRTVDDAFVYLDSIPVQSPLPDMGIGRIAVSTPEEAETAIEMIRSYMVEPESGPWRQRILLAADDPVRPNNDEPSFILETEQLANKVPPYLQVIKLYLTEYAEAFDPATNSIFKPDATIDLIQWVNRGVTLINYVGHGSSTQWAQEQLLKMERDRALLQPGSRLPVWFAGTCTWGRFDQLDIPSMSEVLTVSTENAAIAVVSAVRAVYAGANFRFIRDLFAQAFPGREPASLRIGVIVQSTKTGSASDEKFHLFGDPAILIGFPREPLTLNPVIPDTLKVLGVGTYSGLTGDGGVSSGECLVTVLDSPNQVTRPYQTMNGIDRSITYTLTGASVFRGSAAISNGSFEGQFIVPKDINYRGHPATIIGYGWSDQGGQLREQIGHRDDLLIQGTAPSILDSTGPLITLYWEGRPLVSEDALPEGTQIEVELKDPLGINLTGEVGHSIRVWVDDESSVEVVNPLFQYNIDSHTAGRFPHQFDPAQTGRHEFFVEAWDGANNKSISTTTIHFALEEELSATHLYNYPNPFQDHTEFVYTLSRPAEVTITIYTLNGTKVLTLESLGEQGSGFHRLPETGPWEGRDAFGDQIANGTYLYHFQATGDGKTIAKWGRLARLR
jgi:hypothetical protein